MFERLRIPTPFQVGSVNCYHAGRTLVDPGPDSEESWSTLTSALANRGLEPDDIDRVLITHPHPDHFGLARRLRDNGARIMAANDAVDIIEDFPGRLEYEQSFFREFLPRHGVAPDVAETVLELPEAYLEFAPSATVDRALEDGDVVEVADTTVSVESVTGHATGEVLFTWTDESGEQALVGDHVLQTITPNPFLQPPAKPGGRRPRMLPAYNRSLEHLATRDFATLWPGHGEVVERPTHRIERLLEYHERRTANVRRAIDGPTTAVEVMRDLFGDLPVTELYGGMSEAIGHLDVLQLRGELERTSVDGVWHYERADQ